MNESRTDEAAPAVVIVHGAWVDPASWREVIALLHAKGVGAIAVQSPLSALTDDVDAVTRALNHQSNPLVLVGHGYGGTVITQAGNHPAVAGLVYIAACAPDRGESTADVHDPSSLPVVGLEVDARGFLCLATSAVLEFLAHDLPATEGLVLAASQKPIRASALLDRVTEAAWHSKPSWYAVTAEDRMMSPVLQREIASRINATVLILRAGHVPFLSKPKETADVILAAATFVRRRGLGR